MERTPTEHGAPQAPSNVQSATPYLDALVDYAGRGAQRLHVPGHKGGAASGPRLKEALGAALSLDVPACTRGIDVGARVTPLDEAQALAAEAWGAARTWFLVNGASEGNHAVCVALRQLGSRAVVQRNVHSSAIHGLVLAGLEPVFVGPEIDLERGVAHCVEPSSVAAALDRAPDAAAVMLVSPTYFGSTADLRAIAELCRERGVPLVVDEAWGGHFRFHESLPEDALSAGADVVLSGTHKTIGSLTQSAMLHVGAGAGGAVCDALDKAFGLLRSTSPNALLMASLDAARSDAAVEGPRRLPEAVADMGLVRAAVREIAGLDTLDERMVGTPGVSGFDPLRLAIDVRATGISGFDLSDRVHRAADVNLEMVTSTIAVAHFGLLEQVIPGGTALVKALASAVEGAWGAVRPPACPAARPPAAGPVAISPREAYFSPQEPASLEEAVGRIAAESVVVYPPGIANVLPGEQLTRENVDFLAHVRGSGGTFRGCTDPSLRTIRVLRDPRHGSRSPSACR
jgi:arginine/lysine/ornithine decarboxylase